MSKLDESGIPFSVKSVDDVGLVVEASEYTGADHNIILRYTKPVGQNDDNPDYDKPPKQAAKDHWARVKVSLANSPEFEAVKDRVWLETFNEARIKPDLDDPNWDNMHPANWLGWFAYYLALEGMADGYKMLVFGMNAGQPEPQDWLRDGMTQLLGLCAQYPDQVAISLHEGKVGDMKDPIANYIPHLIGRFMVLNDVCENTLNIKTPTIMVSEWAWAYNDMPDQALAMRDLAELSNLMSIYPNVKGVFLWNLAGGPQWPNLPHMLQKLIEPITEFTLNTLYPDVVDPPPTGDDPPPTVVVENLLANPSFEGGWYHPSGIPELQIANNWITAFKQGPTEVDGEIVDFARPEYRVLPSSQLPPAERDLFILDGDQTVKIFKGNLPLSCKYMSDAIQLEAGAYTFVVKVYPDLVMGYQNGEKVYADDPLAGRVRAYINGVVGDWIHPFPFGQWYTMVFKFTVDAPRLFSLGLQLQNKWGLNNNGWFIDDWSLVLDPEDDPPPPPPVDDPPPEDPDPPNSLAQALWQDSLKTQAIQLFPDAALQKVITRDGYQAVSSEQRIAYNGVAYAYQSAEHLSSGDRRVYYTAVGDWSNVKYISSGDSPPPPPPPPEDPPPPPPTDDPPPEDPQTNTVFYSPVGTQPERESGEFPPAKWIDSNPIGTSYTNPSTGRTSYHTGADLNLNFPYWDADRDSPIFSIGSGVVTFAGLRPVWGNLIVIKHDPDPLGRVWVTRSAHVTDMIVSAGDRVARGQQIARIGQDALGGAFHLHFDLGHTDAMVINAGDWPANDIDRLWANYTDPRAILDNNTPPPPPPAATGNPLFGIHASADGTPPNIQAEVQVFTESKADLIKVLSSASPQTVGALANARPNASWIVRAFLSMTGRDISPEQFYTDTISDVIRTINKIKGLSPHAYIALELHNEPNLTAEGLGSSWADGYEFATWIKEVSRLYKGALPQMPMLYPALSPSGYIPNVRQDSTEFLNQSMSALTAFDGFACHIYWNTLAGSTDSLEKGLNVLDEYLAMVPSLPVWITESSNNKHADNNAKADQYIEFWEALKFRPRVKGVTYYVSSATDPLFADETWVGTVIPLRVGNR